MSFWHAKLFPHRLTKFLARLSCLNRYLAPLISGHVLSLARKFVQYPLVRIRKLSDLSPTANAEINVSILHCVVRCLQVFTSVNLLAAASIQVQLIHLLPERVRRNQIVMTCLAALISNGTALLLAVGINARSFSPPVVECSSRKAEQPSYGDATKDSTEGEPSVRIGHRHLPGPDPSSGFGGINSR